MARGFEEMQPKFAALGQCLRRFADSVRRQDRRLAEQALDDASLAERIAGCGGDWGELYGAAHAGYLSLQCVAEDGGIEWQ